MIIIRNETKNDYKEVEKITREAFYNLYIPGCVEHYLVHIMREHEDFIPELDLVIELDGEIIGNIMYTKAKLVDGKGNKKDILTFGPLCILPKYQRKGYGKKLLEESFKRAIKMGYDTIVIFGSPSNYVSSGFKSCKKYNMCMEKDVFPTAMMVKELIPNKLDGRRWTYHGSSVMHIDETEAENYDSTLEKLEKKYKVTQEEFYILSHSTIK